MSERRWYFARHFSRRRRFLRWVPCPDCNDGVFVSWWRRVVLIHDDYHPHFVYSLWRHRLIGSNGKVVRL